MAVQFTPPRDVDDQEEIDRRRAARAAPPDFSADPRALDPEERQRIGRLAFRWFFIRVLFWTPLILTVAVPAGWLAYLLTAAGAFGSQGPDMPWFVAVCIGFAAACYVVRILGGIAAFRGPLRLRVGQPRNPIEAVAGGIFSGLTSIYCAYVALFWGVIVILVTGLLGIQIIPMPHGGYIPPA